MRFALLASAAFVLIGLVGQAGAQSQSFDPIVTRQNGQDLVFAVTSDMKRAVKTNEDVKPFADGAKAISQWALQFPTLFPPGSDKGHDTKALQTVWSDRGGFEKAAATLSDAAAKLSAAAKAGDQAAFAERFDAMTKACAACHKTYKAKTE